MTFDEILEQLITLLKRQGQVSYRALKRRFDLDDAYLEALKGEIIFAYPVVDEGGARTCLDWRIRNHFSGPEPERQILGTSRCHQSCSTLDSQGKRDEARELLKPAYSRFTEGFDTADLIAAKTLLDELA
jgi:hypothetical protein